MLTSDKMMYISCDMLICVSLRTFCIVYQIKVSTVLWPEIRSDEYQHFTVSTSMYTRTHQQMR